MSEKPARKSRSIAVAVFHASPSQSGKPLKKATVAEIDGQPGWLVKVKSVQELFEMAHEVDSIRLSLVESGTALMPAITVGPSGAKASA